MPLDYARQSNTSPNEWVETGITESASDNPFDLAKLALRQDFLEITPVKKLLTTVPVRRPGPQEFVRVCSNPDYRALMAILELKGDCDRDVYVVNLRAVPEVQGECYVATVFTAINRSGTLFLWPARIPATERPNAWHVSGLNAANRAMAEWLKIKANMSLGAYEMYLPENPIPDPEWPSYSFLQLIQIAFRDKLIDSYDHPVLRQLRGA